MIMNCEHKVDDVCAIASELAGLKVLPAEDACDACQKCDKPKQVNNVTASIACEAVRKAEPDRYREMVEEMRPYLKTTASFREAAKYTESTTTWLATGAKVRSDDEVKALLEICKGCPHYRPRSEDVGACGICGCRLSLGGGFGNKLRRTTERCPDKRW